MGACCFRPRSPCGSVEERSGLLNDDTKAAGPSGHLAATLDGTCGLQGDDDGRKRPDVVTLKAAGTDDMQVKPLPQFDASEQLVARENGGSLPREAAHVSGKAAAAAAAALDPSAITEESLETFQDESGSSDLPQEADAQLEDGDRRAASSVRVEIQDGGPQDAQMYADVSDVCRRDDEGDAGSKAANGRTPAKEDEAPSSAGAQEATVAATCREDTSEPNRLASECSALTRGQHESGQDESGQDESVEPAEAKPAAEHKRPAQTPTATPEVAGSPFARTQKPRESLVQRAADGQGGGRPAAAEAEEETEETPQVLPEEVRAAAGSLRSSEEELYRGEEESAKDTRAAPSESSALEARCSLGPAVDILSYSEREWRGNTAKSALMRKGYKELSQRFAGVRQVRGDNYCALRAALFQVLSQASQVPTWLQDDAAAAALLQDLSELTAQWTFPGEAEAQPDVKRRLQSYLQILRNKWHAAARCPSAAERRRLCNAAFRGGEEEVAMLEALKLLMLRRAVHLHAGMCGGGGGEVPLFCWLLFARDSSACPRAFLANHLSRVGVSAGLEQVEMCLLGDVLRCTLQVYRLYMADTEEFVAYYPDEHKDEWPRVSLVTEDDRHYNVPVVDMDQEDKEEMEEEEKKAAAAS